MALTVRYFAALRDRMGRSEETLDPAKLGVSIASPAALVDWLLERDEGAEALIEPSVRVIINDEIQPRDHALADGDVIAFCPPFSGG